MTPAAPTPPTPDTDGVRLVDACPQCGYSLAGSADAGICPECGTAYNQSMIVLHGAARGTLSNLANGIPRRLVWQIAYSAIALTYLHSTVGLSLRNPLVLVVAGYVASVAMLAMARRFLSDRPGLVQVYLRADGFLQRDHDDRSMLYTLDKVGPRVFTVVMISLLLRASHDVVAERLGGVVLVASVVVVAAALAYHFVAHRPDRPPAPLAVFKLWRRTWREVDEMTLAPAGPSTFRLQLRKRLREMFNDSFTTFADAEVTCTPAQAGRLRTVIGGWMAEGHRASGPPPV